MESTLEGLQALAIYREVSGIPSNFEQRVVMEKIVSGKVKIPTYRKPRNELLESFQQLFDVTNIRKRTRDRRGEVPVRLEIQRVVHNQNHKSYVDYVRGRGKIMKRRTSDAYN